MRIRDTGYCSFLVRLWMEHGSTHPENAAQEPIWRFSVEDPHTSERRGFARLSALVAFLQAQMDRQPENGVPTMDQAKTDESESGSTPPMQSHGGNV